jgi:hypothetical protein
LRTKPSIIVFVTLAAVGLVLSLAGCGSGDSERQGGGSKSSSGKGLQPLEPGFPQRSPNYGVADRPSRGDIPPPADRDYGSPYPPYRSYERDYGIAGGPSRGNIPPPVDRDYGSPYPPYRSHDRNYAPYPSADRSQSRPDQYNFRPLTEREKQRMRGGSGYPSFQGPRSEYDYAQTPPAPSWSAPMYPQLQRQGYSYWPLNPPGANNAPEGPAWSPEREHVDQRGAPPRNPYAPSRPWSPPATRMLPNLDEDGHQSFAAR